MSSPAEGVATRRQPVAQARPVDSSEGIIPRQAASAAAGAPAVQAMPVMDGGGIPSSQEMAMAAAAAAAAAGGAGMLPGAAMLPALHPAAGLGPMMGGLSSEQLNVLCMQAAVAAMQLHGNPAWPLPGMPGVPSQVGWPTGFDPANPLGAPVRTFLHSTNLSRPSWASFSAWPLGTGHERLAHTCCCGCGQGIPEQAAAAAAAVAAAATGAQGQAGAAGSDSGSAPNPQSGRSGRRRGRPRKGQEMTDEERKARRKEINRQAGIARPTPPPATWPVP